MSIVKEESSMPLMVEVVYATMTKDGKVRKCVTGIMAGADGALGKAILKLTDEAFDVAKAEAKISLKEEVIGVQSIKLMMTNLANIRRECGGIPSELFSDVSFDEAGHDQILTVDHEWPKARKQKEGTA